MYRSNTRSHLRLVGGKVYFLQRLQTGKCVQWTFPCLELGADSVSVSVAASVEGQVGRDVWWA